MGRVATRFTNNYNNNPNMGFDACSMELITGEARRTHSALALFSGEWKVHLTTIPPY